MQQNVYISFSTTRRPEQLVAYKNVEITSLSTYLPGGPKKWYLSYNVIYVREVSLFLAHPV